MKITKILKTLCVLALASAGACMLSSCIDSGAGNNNPYGLTGGVAATVNGSEIPEDTITLQIQKWRETYGFAEEAAWGEYLATSAMTPEGVRTQILDGLIDEELIKQAIKEKKVEITASEIDAKIDPMKANYKTEDAWQQALQNAGWTEESYRGEIEWVLQKAKLKEVVAPLRDPTAEEVLEYAQMIKSSIDGAKRSSHILFELTDKEKAQEILDKANAGELDFAEAAKEYSKDFGSAINGGDVGWDKLSTFVEPFQKALNELEVGQISGLVESEFGFHIIKCKEVFTAPEEISDESQVPVEFIEAINRVLPNTLQDEAYNKWVAEYKEAANIVINPLPENVPYNVDVTKYKTSESEEGGYLSEAEEEGSGSEQNTEADGSTGEGSESAEANGSSSNPPSGQPAAS